MKHVRIRNFICALAAALSIALPHSCARAALVQTDPAGYAEEAAEGAAEGAAEEAAEGTAAEMPGGLIVPETEDDGDEPGGPADATAGPADEPGADADEAEAAADEPGADATAGPADEPGADADETEAAADVPDRTTDESGADAAADEYIETEMPADGILPDADVLYDNYLRRTFYGEPARLFRAGRIAGQSLTGVSRYVYDVLKTAVRAAADGESSSSVITVTGFYDLLDQTVFTAQDLGLKTIFGSDGKLTGEARAAVRERIGWNAARTINALAADCPYDMYWYDKTVGFQHSISLALNVREGTVSVPAASRITIYLPVERDYAAHYEEGKVNTDLDTDKTGAAMKAVSYAAKIVEEAGGLTDLEKLRFYKDRICALVRYDREAAAQGAQYGDPWQLVSVFDQDPRTNVVCEGYAKAFQYLCELSDFDSDVSVISVTGQLGRNRNDTENHMWNIIRMDGGRGYLVDVTNCDGAGVGGPDGLFMIRLRAEEEGWYLAPDAGLYYQYDQNTRTLFSDEDLDVHRHESADDGRLCEVCGARRWYLVTLEPRMEDASQISAELRGGGRYDADPDDDDAEVSARISAPLPDGLDFAGWYDASGHPVSDRLQFEMVLTDDVKLTALYRPRQNTEDDPADSKENSQGDTAGDVDSDAEEAGVETGISAQESGSGEQAEAAVLERAQYHEPSASSQGADKSFASDDEEEAAGQEAQTEGGGPGTRRSPDSGDAQDAGNYLSLALIAAVILLVVVNRGRITEWLRELSAADSEEDEERRNLPDWKYLTALAVRKGTAMDFKREMIREHFIFYGQVQGVGFRYQAVNAARIYGLTGWVENKSDGTVEMEAQGTPDGIARMLTRLRSARWIRIDDMEVEEIPLAEAERGFRVQGYSY